MIKILIIKIIKWYIFVSCILSCFGFVYECVKLNGDIDGHIDWENAIIHMTAFIACAYVAYKTFKFL